MSDRTMIAVGRNTLAVPRLAKRALQVLTAVGLTALVALAVIAVNGMLIGRGGPIAGFNIWYAFITRPEIMGTTVLTAIVTTAYLFWTKPTDGKR